MITALIIIFAIVFAYGLLLALTQDFKAQGVGNSIFRNSTKITNILFVYPHPDDETMASGGLMNKLSRSPDFNVHAITLTKGEKGKELLNIEDNLLAQQRSSEYSEAVGILGVSQYELWSYPDGGVLENNDLMKKQIEEYISKNNIQTVITYERTGIYGHKDHVALSKAINEIQKENSDLKVFYSTMPVRYEKLLNFPSHIKDLELTKTTYCETPEYRINIWSSVWNKYKAARSHKSQKLSHGYPLWLPLFLLPFEYYTTVYEDPISKF